MIPKMSPAGQKWLRFGLYLLLILLINLVSADLFFRIDLTANKVYSLSSLSRRSVSSLEEPLTVRIFLSENLPVPYNNLARELRDLMEEYALKGNRFFNYRIDEIDSRGEGRDEKGTLLTELAQGYGIRPVRIESYENNEVSLVEVYMGAAVLQGDLSQAESALGFRENLELWFTTAIDAIAAKTSAILAMEQDMRVTLIFPSLLGELDPAYRDYPRRVEALVRALGGEYFDRLAFRRLSPGAEEEEALRRYKPSRHSLRRSPEAPPEEITAALVVERGERFEVIDLIAPSFQGSAVREPAALEAPLRAVADRLLEVRKTLGYLADHGAPPLGAYGASPAESMENLSKLLAEDYRVEPVSLKALPEGLGTLIIAGVQTPFSDWELFQLDQFLLSGGSVALFLDPYREELPPENAPEGEQPRYVPIHTGLDGFLAHHGLSLKQAYLMDKRGASVRMPAPGGGLEEVELPFAPQIAGADIDNRVPIMKTIKGLVMLQVAPLEILPGPGPAPRVLFSSSPEAWEMTENLTLVPQLIYPPGGEVLRSYPLSALVEGEFSSFFSQRGAPSPPAAFLREGGVLGAAREVPAPLDRGRGRLFLLGSSQVLRDNIIDPEGASPNALFVRNVVDLLAGREDLALMRSKGLSYNPIRGDISGGAKAFIRAFNVAVLPLAAVLAGLLMWLRRAGRKKQIRRAFAREEGEP